MSQYPSLTDTTVKETLLQDKGQGAQLVSWRVEDFLKPGDNYVSTVTSVRVQYELEGPRETSYIVKLKRKRLGDAPSHFDNMTFEKEGKFFTELFPLLNAALLSAGLTPLQIPRCYHSTWTEGQDYLFLEDLRSRGFKRHERAKELHEAHTRLVLQELAKVHAASLLLSREVKGDLRTKYRFLEWEWHNYNDEARKEFTTLFTGSLKNTSALASSLGFDSVAEWFKETSSRGCDVVEEQLERGATYVICHGDLCTNNIMFRYNDEGHPVEAMLLDFQVCRVASPATDLNYLIFSSLTRTNRKSIDEYLSEYHSAFNAVLKAAGNESPFEKVENLRQEFNLKNTFGFAYASILIPVLVAKTHEVVDISGDMEGVVDELQRNAEKMLDNNPLLKERLRGLFQDIIEFLEL